MSEIDLQIRDTKCNFFPSSQLQPFPQKLWSVRCVAQVRVVLSSLCPISERGLSLEMFSPTKGWFSQDRPHDPLGKTTGSLFAPLLTSLSFCEVKIQSCILLNGQTAAGVKHLCCDGGEWMRERVRAAAARKPLDPNNQNMVSPSVLKFRGIFLFYYYIWKYAVYLVSQYEIV